MANSLDADVKKFVEEVGGYGVCRRAGLSAMMQAFYCGMRLSDCTGEASPDEVANDLGLSTREYNYWDDLYYKKNSWFNQMG
jgi:hypothetical protein